MLNISEWMMVASTMVFWQAYPLRLVFIYWLAVGVIIAAKWLFKF